jgi:hypothetical protein
MPSAPSVVAQAECCHCGNAELKACVPRRPLSRKHCVVAEHVHQPRALGGRHAVSLECCRSAVRQRALDRLNLSAHVCRQPGGKAVAPSATRARTHWSDALHHPGALFGPTYRLRVRKRGSFVRRKIRRTPAPLRQPVGRASTGCSTACFALCQRGPPQNCKRAPDSVATQRASPRVELSVRPTWPDACPDTPLSNGYTPYQLPFISIVACVVTDLAIATASCRLDCDCAAVRVDRRTHACRCACRICAGRKR